MAFYQVNWRRSTKKDLRRISPPEVAKIVETVQTLSVEPRPLGCKKMVGSECAYRLRVGDYRILAMIEDEKVVITVVEVGHRKDIYR